MPDAPTDSADRLAAIRKRMRDPWHGVAGAYPACASAHPSYTG